MFAEGHEVEWATPVLYLRSPDGRIFAVGPIPDAERQAREDAERQAREDAERQAPGGGRPAGREDAERRVKDLDTHYALACASAEAQDWDQALMAFTMITELDPGYRDAPGTRTSTHASSNWSPG